MELHTRVEAGPVCVEMKGAFLCVDGVPVSRGPGVGELYCSWNATSPRLVVQKSPHPLRRALQVKSLVEV